MVALFALVRDVPQTSEPTSPEMLGPNEIVVSDVPVIVPLLGQGGLGKGSCG